MISDPVQEPTKKKMFKFGILSFVISILNPFILCAQLSISEASSAFIIGVVQITQCIWILLWITGITFAIIDLARKHNPKGWAIAGLTINALCFCPMVIMHLLMLLNLPAGSTSTITPTHRATATRLISTSVPSPTLEPPTITPSATPYPTNVLFLDAFSDPDSGWSTWSYDSSTVAYSDGMLVFTLNDEWVEAWSTNPHSYTNVRLSVDSTWDGVHDSTSEIRCRIQDQNNYYYGAIGYYYGGGAYSSTRFERFTVGVIKDGVGSLFTTNGWGDAEFNNRNTNQMTFSCVDDQLTLSVNGAVLLSVRDDTFSEGYIGLATDTSHQTYPVTVTYDDFRAEPAP